MSLYAKLNWDKFASGCTAYNLGTGRGTSVLEMVTAFEKASGKVIIHLPDIHVYLCTQKKTHLKVFVSIGC